MKKFISLVNTTKLAGCLLLMVLAFSGIGQAATVRGRVDHIYSNGRRSVAGIAVTVSQSGRRSSPTYTDARGMFYLQNIPPGNYVLEIWASPDSRVPPRSYRIQVRDPLTDLQPLLI